MRQTVHPNDPVSQPTNSWKSAWLTLLAMILFASSNNFAFSQIIAGGGLPNNRYYASFIDYRAANYTRAGKDFYRGLSTAYQLGDRRFVDSVCYWVMAGECHYHLGNYSQALEFFERGLSLYVEQTKAGWQDRVTLPTQILPLQTPVQTSRVGWGNPSRTSIANIPRSMSVLFGRMDAGRAYVEGGLLDRPEQRSVDVREVMRCTALALHRRRNILGATAKYSPLSATIVSGLAGARGQGPMFRAWNGVLLGLAQATMEDWQVASRTLNKSLSFSGMDHNLTPVALVALCQCAFATGDMNTAQQLALEASLSAGMQNQYDLVEEALSMGTILHLMRNSGTYPPLENAIAWGTSQRARMLTASLTERLATCLVEANSADVAAEVLKRARAPMRSNSLSKSVVGSRIQYVNAQIEFMRGNSDAGYKSLEDAVSQFQTGSRWLFQLGLADQLAMSGDISGRKADQLYSALLRDPSATEWTIEPFECIAYLMTPHVAAMERWFETKLLNRQYDQAVQVSELVRRHRFYANLPMGGRLLAFRWLLEGPEESLTGNMKKQRQKFLDSNPVYKELSDRAKTIRSELIALPLQPDADSAEFKKQTELFVQLSQVSKSQEAIIAGYALRRQPADMAFPPRGDLSSFLNQIRPHQAAYVTLATQNGLHAFLIANNRHNYLGTVRNRDVRSAVSRFLKKLGLQDFSGGLDLETFEDDTWVVDSNNVAKTILLNDNEFGWGQFKELVVVPDSVLWYVPFELLHVAKSAGAVAKAGALDPANLNKAPDTNDDPDDTIDDPDAADDPDADDKKPKKKSSRSRKKNPDVDPATLDRLGDKLLIRYAPTLYSAFGIQRPTRTMARTAIMLGRMHPKGEIEVTQEAVKELQTEIPNAATFESMRIPTNYFGTIIDRMIVCSDIKLPQRGGVFAISPAELDRGLNEGSNLAAWLSFPFWAPEHIVMPGFTSGGAAGGRGKGDGQELFLTSCSLLASGARAVMISRWRVGGANSLELARNYAKKLESMTPVKALQASIEESKKLDLDFEKEPRIKPKKTAQPIKAEHPFFWAGNMIVEVPNAATIDNPDKAKDALDDAKDAPNQAADQGDGEMADQDNGAQPEADLLSDESTDDSSKDAPTDAKEETPTEEDESDEDKKEDDG